MRAIVILMAVVLATAGGMGCGLRRPFERPPGTVEQQRREAAAHDPYADNDLGPEVVGGRPREFSKPDPVAERSRAHPASQNGMTGGWFSRWFSP
ncbi:MAG: hypothetical protein AB7F89_21730 [Pirellulaceae bacterium]